MTTNEMLLALSTSTDSLSNQIASDILFGRDTIEHQKTVCGKFFQHVFDGKYLDAFRIADNKNKHAFVRWLIENDQQEKAQQLINSKK